MTEAAPVAMEVWKAARRAFQNTPYHEATILTKSDQAAAAVIATALADMQRRVEALEGALRKLDEELEESGFASIGTKRRIITQALSDKTQGSGDSHPTSDLV